MLNDLGPEQGHQSGPDCCQTLGKWSFTWRFLAMGQVFPACLVSDEMEEIFVGNVRFLERLGGRKTGPGPGLDGWKMAREGSRAVGRE